MNVLVIRKPSNFETHSAKVKEIIDLGGFKKSRLEDLERAHEQHYQTFETLLKALKTHDISTHEMSREESWPDAPFDCVFTVGGDGTLLSASSNIGDGGKIIGIRSSDSSVGCLCAGGLDDIETIIDNFVSSRLPFKTVSRIKAQITQIKKQNTFDTQPALNELLFADANPAATTRYLLRKGDDTELQKSSGIYVSTVIGSTGSIFAAGGRQMSWTEKSFQFLVREPYSFRGSSLKIVKGDLDPDKELLEIENHSAQAILASDGQRDLINLDYGDKVKFLRGPSLCIAQEDIDI